MKIGSMNSFKELGLPYFKEVFALVDEVMINHQTPYYLIGATAISLKLMQEGYRPSRGTKDIDFAIMVSSLAKYDAIKDDLIAKGFNKVESEITLYHPEYNTTIDLLPFGEVEEQNTEQFTQRKIDLVVLGYRETLEHTEKIIIDEHLVVNIPPLPAITMLKLISWNDRPEIRSQDLDDIYLIISKYFDIATDEIYEQHADLLEMEPFNRFLIAARLLGRKISVYLHKSETVKARVLQILRQQVKSSDDHEIVIQWAQKHDLTVGASRQLLLELQHGIEESL
jgi:predicted nucleotidyltransferase